MCWKHCTTNSCLVPKLLWKQIQHPKENFLGTYDQIQHVCAFLHERHYLLLYVTQHDTEWEGC